MPDYLLDTLNRPRGLRRVVRLLLVGTTASSSQPWLTPAGQFGPSFAVEQLVVVQVQEVHEPTAPPVAHGQMWTRVHISDVTAMA